MGMKSSLSINAICTKVWLICTTIEALPLSVSHSLDLSSISVSHYLVNSHHEPPLLQLPVHREPPLLQLPVHREPPLSHVSTSLVNLNLSCRELEPPLSQLHKRILNFCPLTNNKGENIGRKIEKCLEGWLIGRVFSITVDNVSSNDVAISYLKSGIEDWNTNPLKEEQLHVRYCAHILNLVVNDGLKEYHSSIRKIRNVVKYVRASPDHMDRFKIFIKEAKLVEKSIMQLDVSTRSNSTYIMLESALKFQKVFKRLGEKFSKYVILNDELGPIPPLDEENFDIESD
ncbi:hypothetical protein JHK84_042953 [Glycine max]|nr:hypothetical protein JHK84_042953 [Glycine max]